MTDALALRVVINQQAHELACGATLADAVVAAAIQGTFAAAVNMHFVPRGQYATHALKQGDHIELIAPITGG